MPDTRCSQEKLTRQLHADIYNSGVGGMPPPDELMKEELDFEKEEELTKVSVIM